MVHKTLKQMQFRRNTFLNYIKTLSSIFPGVPLIPTGGIKPNEVKEYLDNGAICVGLGGVLINETLINQGERKMIFNASMEILKQAKL